MVQIIIWTDNSDADLLSIAGDDLAKNLRRNAHSFFHGIFSGRISDINAQKNRRKNSIKF